MQWWHHIYNVYAVTIFHTLISMLQLTEPNITNFEEKQIVYNFNKYLGDLKKSKTTKED